MKIIIYLPSEMLRPIARNPHSGCHRIRPPRNDRIRGASAVAVRAPFFNGGKKEDDDGEVARAQSVPLGQCAAEKRDANRADACISASRIGDRTYRSAENARTRADEAKDWGEWKCNDASAD